MNELMRAKLAELSADPEIKKADEDSARYPLYTPMEGILYDFRKIPASIKVIEYDDGTVEHREISEHYLLKYKATYDGRTWDFDKRLFYKDPAQVEKFHAAVDRAVALTTKELSRHWKIQDMFRFLLDNHFPCYAGVYEGRPYLALGEYHEVEPAPEKPLLEPVKTERRSRKSK